MDLVLEGKVAIVTGSGEGIGRRTILTFAEEGANVVVNDIVPSKVETVVNEVQRLGAKALGAVADVTNADEVNDMVKKVISEFGRIDILVNNAYLSDRKFFALSSRQDWDKPINVCLYGTLNCTRAVIGHMIEQGYGKIISVVSDAARVGEAINPAYAAAKGGILSFSKTLALEEGRHNINVNCVAPSATNTERRIRERQQRWEQATEEERKKIKERDEGQLRLYPLRRLGQPEDLANMIVFLASERASWITGQCISVNGGFAMV